jgi:hypothetical protein
MCSATWKVRLFRMVNRKGTQVIIWYSSIQCTFLNLLNPSTFIKFRKGYKIHKTGLFPSTYQGEDSSLPRGNALESSTPLPISRISQHIRGKRPWNELSLHLFHLRPISHFHHVGIVHNKELIHAYQDGMYYNGMLFRPSSTNPTCSKCHRNL